MKRARPMTVRTRGPAAATPPVLARPRAAATGSPNGRAPERLRIVILGLSVTSSWGNGHATNYRGLMRALTERGHEVLFLERDRPWYADNRDMRKPPWGRTELYRSVPELKRRFSREVREADVVVVGSYVPCGVEVGAWVTATAEGVRAFYDIDTPVTLAKLERGDHEYLTPALVRRYDLYLSFTGGPTLRRIERELGSPMARAFYCLVDPELYRPDDVTARYDLGYLGTYSDDRQPTLEALMLEPARRWRDGRFVAAGPQYPKSVRWPRNVRRIEHLAPAKHRAFYCAQRFTLNVTRRDMVRAGWSPSVRLFEAAACGTPIISDHWPGLEDILTPGREVLISGGPEDTLAFLRELPERERADIGERARRRVLAEHTAEHRAREFEEHVSRARSRDALARRA